MHGKGLTLNCGRQGFLICTSFGRYLLKLRTEVDVMQQLGASLDSVYLQVPFPFPYSAQNDLKLEGMQELGSSLNLAATPPPHPLLLTHTYRSLQPTTG